MKNIFLLKILITEYQHAAQSKYINKSFSLVVGNYTIYWNKITFLLACVAGVRKGRGRELGCETTRERGRRSGTHARKLLFSISHLLIKKNDTNMAAGFIVVVHRCGGHDVM